MAGVPTRFNRSRVLGAKDSRGKPRGTISKNWGGVGSLEPLKPSILEPYLFTSLQSLVSSLGFSRSPTSVTPIETDKRPTTADETQLGP
jgi:hypothetical protein